MADVIFGFYVVVVVDYYYGYYLFWEVLRVLVEMGLDLYGLKVVLMGLVISFLGGYIWEAVFFILYGYNNFKLFF